MLQIIHTAAHAQHPGSKRDIVGPYGIADIINGEEGLNEHGLAVAMTFVMTSLQKIRPGFNSCFVVRYLLEKADNMHNIQEAKEI